MKATDEKDKMISALNNRVKELEGKLKKIEYLFIDSKLEKQGIGTLGRNKNNNSEKNLLNLIKNKDLTTKLSLSFSNNDKLKVATPKKQLVNVELYKPLIPHSKYKNKPPLMKVNSKVKSDGVFITETCEKVNTDKNEASEEGLTFVEKLKRIKNRTKSLLDIYNQQNTGLIKHIENNN
jgi:hypothetical protein